MRIKVSIRNHRAAEREEDAKAEDAAKVEKGTVEKVKKPKDAAVTVEPVVEVAK